MNLRLLCTLTLLSHVLLGTCVPLRAGLVEKWTFNDLPSAANGTGIAGENGRIATIRGADAVSTGAGLSLPGGSSATQAYIDLPNGLISTLTDLTVEVWITVDTRQNYQRVFDFGRSSAGEITGPGGSFGSDNGIGLIPNVETNANHNRMFFQRPDSVVSLVDTAVPIALGTRHLFTYVWEDRTVPPALPSAVQQWYLDGVLVGQSAPFNGSLSETIDVNNWLGRSNYSGDSNTDGTYDECAIYDHAMGAAEVQARFAAGSVPNTPPVYEKVFDFKQAREADLVNKGRLPFSELVQGSDGNFYGTTEKGGKHDSGTVFKMTPPGVLTTLVEFEGFSSTGPRGKLVQGGDGNFYGTTEQGGAFEIGTVFKMTPGGALTTLVQFTGNAWPNKGSRPRSGLVQGRDGNFYGTTLQGGQNDGGTIFKVTATGTLTTLVEFTANPGIGPSALVQGSDGDFYGTTLYGLGGGGTVFRMTTNGTPQGTTVIPLVVFDPVGPENYGQFPNSLVEGSDRNFYGTTNVSIFKMTPAGALTTLAIVGSSGALLQGRDGNFYGTTSGGGAGNFGTVFKMTTNGTPLGTTLTSLVAFTENGESNKGRQPYAGLVQGIDGHFYGTTYAGGAGGYGTVFKVDPNAPPNTGLTTLVEFTSLGFSDKGNIPTNGLVQGSDGNFYGTTAGGGFGTVFGMTPSGVLTTLVEFTGDSGSKKGNFPLAELVQGSDGSFYGTTYLGGQYNRGTVFKMTTNGTLQGTTFATLVEFTENTMSNKGSHPSARLVQGRDGNFYGTTEDGGATGFGTVFKMMPGGALTTLVEFTGEVGPKLGKNPFAGLVQGSDGNFYGTTSAGGVTRNGTIFKMATDGTPQGTVLTTLVDFNFVDGSGPQAELLQASDGYFYGTTLSGGGNLGGTAFWMTTNGTSLGTTRTTLVEFAPESGSPNGALIRGSDGNLYGPTFATIYRLIFPGRPLVNSLAAFADSTGALVTAKVNAVGAVTEVQMEFGTDGATFPTIVPVVVNLTGYQTKLLGTTLEDLVPGTTYYYRFRATSSYGTTVSPVQSFSTLTPPEAVATPATAIMRDLDDLNDNANGSATLNGLVNARNFDTTVDFEYATDENFTFKTTSRVPLVLGNTPMPVSFTVLGLPPGTTYFYRIVASNAGGTTISGTESFTTLTVNRLSEFAQVFPGGVGLGGRQGSLKVNLIVPAGIIGAGWRLVGEQVWHLPGEVVFGLTTSDRAVEFRPVANALQPLREDTVSVFSGQQTVLEREYFQTSGGATGGLTVILKPDGLAGAQWRFLGEDDTQWRNSGVTVTGLLAGVYLVECKPVAGRSTPPPLSVSVLAGQTRTATATYFLFVPPPGTPSAVLPFEIVSASPNLPYAYVGQIRSEAGASTGFVVLPRVVATAGHVVFDDSTLAPTVGLQWLFQRDAGTYEPTPRTPRGFYLRAGYVAQRTLEATPGTSLPASQNLDAAALYFLAPAGRVGSPAEDPLQLGGSSGFVASDAENNEFLTSSASLKTLVGYPVDGDFAANAGRMHATPPANVTFAPAFGRTYTTTAIRSAGGNSGGPLCVQFDNGKYYPAAIYLGGSGQSVVRAIDTDVIALLTAAAISGDNGTNQTSGGVIQGDAVATGSVASPASISVDLQPTAAVTGGAKWRLGSSSTTLYGGAVQINNLTPGNYTLYFSDVAGFTKPPPTPVTLVGGQLLPIMVTYGADGTIIPAITTVPQIIRAIRGKPLPSFTIEATGGPTRFVAGGLAGTGLTFNATTGVLAGTPRSKGEFALTITAENDAGASAPLLLTVIVSEPGKLVVLADSTRGSFSVTPKTAGNIFPEGHKVTLVAKPEGPDFLFAGWQFDGGEKISSLTRATTTFRMTERVVVTANFAPNPFLTRFGGYSGLCSVATGPAGLGTLTLTKTGGFTLRVVLGPRVETLKGKLDVAGNFTGKIRRSGFPTLDVTLHLDLAASGDGALTGTITDGTNTYDLSSTRGVFTVTNPSPAAGRHTLALPPDPAQSNPAIYPAGYGYAVVKVEATGQARAVGQLGDGRSFAVGGAFAGDGTWAIYTQPNGKRSVLGGILNFTDSVEPAIDELAGTLHWVKPSTGKAPFAGGFAGDIAAAGSRYTAAGLPALGLTGWNLALGTGVLSPPLSATATLKTNNRFTLTGPDATALKLELDVTTGRLTGEARLKSGQAPKPFKGILLESQRTGRGVLPVPNGAAPFTLDPP